MHPNQSSRYGSISRFTGLILYPLLLCCGLLFNASFASPVAMVQIQDRRCDVEIQSVQAAKIEHGQVGEWVHVTLPDQWETRWRNYSGMVWYRINWQQQCDDTQQLPLAISIDSINMAGEVYLNQQLIWKDKSLVEPLSRSWNSQRYWILPPASFNQGENTLLIKVVGVATQSPGLGNTYIGSPNFILAHHADSVFRYRTLHFINLIISLTLGIIGFLIWWLRRQDSTFGWFTLASLLWVLFISNTFVTQTPAFSNTIQMAKGSLILLLLYNVCFAIFTWRFAGRKYPKSEYVLWASCLILVLFLVMVPHAQLGGVLSITFLLSMGLFVVNCVFYQWIAYKTAKTDIRILALILLLYIGIVLHDVYRIWIHDTHGVMMAPYAALLMAVAVSLILGWRIAQNITKIESFNEQLEIKIEQVTLELKHSLENKHQLEIENMRLQERLNLSHDLHDGLGGSLVRSIVLVDKAEDFDKQRFMSILKLLRNDLRQIIDSGSSLGAKIPDTPIIWGAPLRHRYVQIFEEMDIQSKWQFPDQWQTLPTALECLTLARVTEEALTNIVKHSQASLVSVTLLLDAESMLLSIEDNGVGFDPSTVQAGLHVGLHSMQVRVKRIGGSIEIVSQPGRTLIQVRIRH